MASPSATEPPRQRLANLRRSPGRARLVRHVLAFAFVVALGAGAYYAWQTVAPGKGVPAGAGYQATVNAALKYAQEIQNGQVQQAALRVAWVQERLARVRAERGGQDAENAALAAVVGAMSAMDRSKAVVVQEGIEDQYLFAPRAKIEAAGADSGRGGLERPVTGRAWLRITYPEPASAPRDEAGRAIKSLTVGVNMSDDQYVLKAEIIGNLEVDSFSIRYF